MIEGYTGERGTREYNISLGQRRAETLKNVLIALGISASRISTISYGKERPEVPHSDETSDTQNRRAGYGRELRKVRNTLPAPACSDNRDVPVHCDRFSER